MLYPTNVTFDGWQLVTADIPVGLSFPLISFIDLLAISPTTTISDTVQVGGIEALYSPRPLVAPTYTAIPENPYWLTFQENSANFSRTGTTTLVGDDGHLLANDAGSTSAKDIAAAKSRLAGLAPAARLAQVQMQMPRSSPLWQRHMVQFLATRVDGGTHERLQDRRFHDERIRQSMLTRTTDPARKSLSFKCLNDLAEDSCIQIDGARTRRRCSSLTYRRPRTSKTSAPLTAVPLARDGRSCQPPGSPTAASPPRGVCASAFCTEPQTSGHVSPRSKITEWPEGVAPSALTDPYVTVSRHTALVVLIFRRC
jgi:hypothetical protein